MEKKIYCVEKYAGGNRNRSSVQQGTLEELTKYFGYTLECGHSYNSKISKTPKTIATLVSALNRSVRYTHNNCYDPPHYTLVN